jgi:translation initiation factor IF-3
VGVLPTEQAMSMAQEVNLDLVEVSPTADPPVCKILDFGKFLYKQRKKEHDAKRKQVVTQIKEIRLRPKTDTHDRGIKMERARRFLTEGNRVQLNMLFRGREMAHLDLGRRLLMDFAEELGDLAKIETVPRRMGRRMNMMLAPKPSVTEAHRREKRKAAEQREKGKTSSRRVKVVQSSGNENTQSPDAAEAKPAEG